MTTNKFYDRKLALFELRPQKVHDFLIRGTDIEVYFNTFFRVSFPVILILLTLQTILGQTG